MCHAQVRRAHPQKWLGSAQVSRDAEWQEQPHDENCELPHLYDGGGLQLESLESSEAWTTVANC